MQMLIDMNSRADAIVATTTMITVRDELPAKSGILLLLKLYMFVSIYVLYYYFASLLYVFCGTILIMLRKYLFLETT